MALSQRLPSFLASRAAPRTVQSTSEQTANALIREFAARWKRGERPDAAELLAAHPELQAQKGIVLDLVYEEYCQRLDAGDVVDADAFCGRFPNFRRSLRRLMAMHRFVEQHPELTAEQATPAWPPQGEPFLGLVLREELGRGAFSRVYLAEEPGLDRLVAVKLSLDSEAEAKALARLDHPNVVPVHYAKSDPGTGLSAICMPYRGRQTLADAIERAYSGTERPSQGRVFLAPLEDAELPLGPTGEVAPDPLLTDGSYLDAVVHIAAQVAEGLAFTHARGIAHHDLKPSNVLLDRSGRPMLLDFNLCTDERAARRRLGGTFPYIPPEQVAANFLGAEPPPPEADPGWDIYSLGVILYELLTGRLPFDDGADLAEMPVHEAALELVQRQRAGPGSLAELHPAVDRRLADLVTRCLAFEPERRPASAAALAAELHGINRPWRRTGRKLRSHRGLIAAGVAAVAIVISGAAFLDRAIHGDPDSAAAWVARGRAHLRQRDFDAARDDFMAARKRGDTAEAEAGLAYCYNYLKQPDLAAECYRHASQLGLASAEVLNNLGFTNLRLGNLVEARQNLDAALRLDDQLQAAWHNRALAGLAEAVQEDRDVTPATLADMERAIGLGPTPDLRVAAARLYCRAQSTVENPLEQALTHLELAAKEGFDVASLGEDTFLAVLRGQPRFQALVNLPLTAAPAARSARILNPVDDEPR